MLRQIPLRTTSVAPSSRLLFRPSSFTTTRLLTTEITTSATQQASTPPPPSAATSTPAPTTPPRQLTYLVERTASQNLSVYNDTRSGGSKKETVIKKIVGDVHAFRSDISTELGFGKDTIKINPVTGHIKIKGFHAEKVQKWLLARGF